MKASKINLQSKKIAANRVECGCMAKEHKLINNCIGCGRIACELDGEGPCFFCGNPVHSAENMNKYEEEVKFLQDLEGDPDLAESYFKAVGHKDKLLEWEQNDVARKNVYDEDTDWYEIKQDVWQSKGVRALAMNKLMEVETEQEESKKGILNINLETGEIGRQETKVDYAKHKEAAENMIKNIEDETKKAKEIEINYINDQKLEEKEKEILSGIQNAYRDKLTYLSQGDRETHQKNMNSFRGLAPSSKIQHDDCYSTFLQAVERSTAPQPSANDDNLYDKQFFKLSSNDTRCLSMWQPWASLVIFGFKRFEGRAWDSDYRGPLWIQAGSKEPTEKEIEIVEAQYREIYKDVKNMPPFPERYPTGC